MYEMKITQNRIDGRLNMAEEKAVNLKTQQNNPILNTKRKEDFFFLMKRAVAQLQESFYPYNWSF